MLRESRSDALPAKIAPAAIFWLVILLSLPAHLMWMKTSIWLDEAWVANSVLAPSVRGMLYYENWIQATPPLFLALVRGWVSLFGASEIGLRMIPLLAGLAAILVFAGIVKRSFPVPLSLAAVTLFCTNYWAIKYGQQIKQYSTDLLAACIFVGLILRVRERGLTRANYAALALFGAVSTFASFPALFWFPTAVLAIAAGTTGWGGSRKPASYADALRSSLPWMGMAAILGLSLAVNYLTVLRHNLSPALFRTWDAEFHGYLARGDLARSFLEFLRNISNLLVPRAASWAAAASYVLTALVGVGAVRSLLGAVRRDRRAVTMVLVGPLPILASVILSLAGKYPLLTYPRVIIWMLPPCYILICYAVEKPLGWILGRLHAPRARLLPAAAISAGCICVVLANHAFFTTRADETEENRQVFTHLANSWRSGDALFLHGGLWEQFYVYRRLLNWTPVPVYVGNTHWPCCYLRKENRVSNPGARTLSEDIDSAFGAEHPRRMWVVFPAGKTGHWSAPFLRPDIAQLPKLMAAKGCSLDERRSFGHVLLESFNCGHDMP